MVRIRPAALVVVVMVIMDSLNLVLDHISRFGSVVCDGVCCSDAPGSLMP